jgi:hypothetical protein
MVIAVGVAPSRESELRNVVQNGVHVRSKECSQRLGAHVPLRAQAHSEGSNDASFGASTRATMSSWSSVQYTSFTVALSNFASSRKASARPRSLDVADSLVGKVRKHDIYICRHGERPLKPPKSNADKGHASTSPGTVASFSPGLGASLVICATPAHHGLGRHCLVKRVFLERMLSGLCDATRG